MSDGLLLLPLIERVEKWSDHYRLEKLLRYLRLKLSERSDRDAARLSHYVEGLGEYKGRVTIWWRSAEIMKAMIPHVRFAWTILDGLEWSTCSEIEHRCHGELIEDRVPDGEESE